MSKNNVLDVGCMEFEKVELEQPEKHVKLCKWSHVFFIYPFTSSDVQISVKNVYFHSYLTVKNSKPTILGGLPTNFHLNFFFKNHAIELHVSPNFGTKTSKIR